VHVVLDALPDPFDRSVLAGRVAVQLGREGVAGLPAALALLVRSTGIRTAVLRRAGDRGDLLGVAGEVVQAVPDGPARRRETAVVALPVRGPQGNELATLVVTGARPSVLPALRDASVVLGLVLAADLPLPVGAALLCDAEAERAVLADALHDGPVQDLVAARYATDAAVRAGDPTQARAAVQAALVALRRTLWQLRPRGAAGLADALDGLSARRVETGRLPLRLRIDPAADVLAATTAVAAYRLVQAATQGPGGDRLVSVALRRQDTPGGRGVVVLTVDGGDPLPDAARWRRAAAALGADLLCGPGRLRLALPVPDPTPAPTAKATP